MTRYYLDYSILAIMIIAVITYSPDAQAESKIKGQVVGIANLIDKSRNTRAVLPGDPSEFTFGNSLFNFNVGLITDHFFGGNYKSAFAVDLYNFQASGSARAGDIETDGEGGFRCPEEAAPCSTEQSQDVRVNALMLGYRYHFSGYDESTGYLGVGALIGSLGGSITRSIDIITLEDDREVTRDLRGGSSYAPALTGGYDWQIGGKKRSSKDSYKRRHKYPLLMGIHLVYSTPTTYGDIEGVRIFNVGYTIGRVVGSK